MWSRGLPEKVAVAGLLLVCFLFSVFAQGPAVRFRVKTNLILMDIRVTDPDGRPVSELAVEDFTVLEEGVLQEITYFREISLPLNFHLAQGMSKPGTVRDRIPDLTVEEVSSELIAPEKRYLILLFNFSGATVQDSRMMQVAAAGFLDKQFTPEDAVAVLSFDQGLELLVDFTSDREKLGRVLGRLSQRERELEISLPEGDVEEEVDAEFLADETEFSLFETNYQLSAIQAVAEAFRDVPGRKALLYFSTGLDSRGIENDDQLRWTTDLCNRANISIYSVDARGLVALSPEGGAHRSGRSSEIFSGRGNLNELAN